MGLPHQAFRNPGAVQFGNFINYYQFNSAEQRLDLLSKEHWVLEKGSEHSPYLVLDVGCNSGVFTQLLRKFLTQVIPSRNIKIYAVDLDPELIKRAKAENNCDNIEFACLDVMVAEDFTKILDYLDKYERTKFDAVCCFSVTMWIHLNHEDTGLQGFLRKLSSLSELLVVEPQPWRCYQTAERRMKRVDKSFPLFLKLKWRSNVVEEIENYLINILQRTKLSSASLTVLLDIKIALSVCYAICLVVKTSKTSDDDCKFCFLLEEENFWRPEGGGSKS
uniref:RNA methyltransferase n=1 Tax=Glossina pallidipes TaxID=7398 RepID=A0A1A9ZIQ6_GLOPL